jgi:hypothetical protein
MSEFIGTKPTEKLCNSCKAILPLGHFHKKSGGRLGLDGRCKKCISRAKKRGAKKIKEFKSFSISSKNVPDRQLFGTALASLILSIRDNG